MSARLSCPGFRRATAIACSPVAAARAAPDTISYGSGGIGSANHLAPEMFAAANGIKLQHVPYHGSGPAMQAVMSGEIPMSSWTRGWRCRSCARASCGRWR